MSTLTLFASQLRLLTNPSALQGEWLAANGFTAASKLARSTMRA